ncbi:AraC family transcriptional regulator [Chitiniphilus purpureus]|uniref:AraC family transcriptional regulator n=1 Tax=Chitiniphilus purpureus TaxID=2981137 RepID=A0ABY6DL78_9NEIS|nr:AraC family transcriptional regulator [Chitiniphilus sp. CD1]UXY14988.1 AraC family transcriptional regulator [Chitiniphilus sp. CD1]
MHSRHRTVRIERAVDCINARYGQALTLDELAARACYSTWHFVRAFEEEVGEAPFDFLRKRRFFAAAYQLLSDRQLPVADLAAQCGFEYASSFAKGFRRLFGMSARDWRAGGWQDWSDGQAWRRPGCPRDDSARGAEYDASQVRRVDPNSIRLEIVPEQPVVYRRLRGLWGPALKPTVIDMLRASPVPVPRFIGARHDLLHLRGPQESCYDVCVPVAPGYVALPTLGHTRLFSGLYAVRRLQPGEPYLSWRSLVDSWPRQGRFAIDPRRPMLEDFDCTQDDMRCIALYLPLTLG